MTPEPGILDDARFSRVVAVLCLTEIVSWGVLYYAFPVLNSSITEDTGWSPSFTMGCFSASLVVTGLAGIPVGRLLDRHGPRLVMTAGSMLAVPAVVVIATAPTRAVFLGGWLLAGVAMAAVLYTPAFTAITHWGGAGALRGLTAVTLVAGFASTVFAPLAAMLEAQSDWRTSYLILAGLLGAVTVPAHLLGLPARWVSRAHDLEAGARTPTPASSREFVVLAVMMGIAAFATYAAVVSLVNLLVAREVSLTAAAVVLGLGGAGQVAGRLFYRGLAARTPLVARTMGTLLVLALTTAAFAVAQGPVLLLIAISVVAGMARGILTLLQATAVPDRWSTVGLGRLNGILAAPAMVASAVAPFAAALLAEPLGGLAPVYGFLAALLVVAALLVPRTVPDRPPPGTDPPT